MDLAKAKDMNYKQVCIELGKHVKALKALGMTEKESQRFILEVLTLSRVADGLIKEHEKK